MGNAEADASDRIGIDGNADFDGSTIRVGNAEGDTSESTGIDGNADFDGSIIRVGNAEGDASDSTGIDGNALLLGSTIREGNGVIVADGMSALPPLPVVGQIGASAGHTFSSLLQHFDSGQMFVMVSHRINSGLQHGARVGVGVKSEFVRQNTDEHNEKLPYVPVKQRSYTILHSAL